MAFNVNKDLNFGLFSVSKKIGPVTAVIDKVFRKSGPTQEEAEALAKANDQARKKRQNDTVSTPGWPFFNHAQDLRRTRGFGTDGQMVVPRMKFTWLLEFRIDELWLNSGQMITSLKSGNFIRDGAIYIPVKAVDHPQVNFEVETLRSFNRYVKVPKKMEYQPASITFDDDSTSLIASLRKEYIHFYHYAGDIGQRMGVSATAPLDEETAINEYQFRSTGMASALGEDVRSRMDEHPSIGMKMRSDCSKHFFQEIVLYDLGMHRDSINAYYFYHPVVTSWGHDGLDYEDRSSKVSINMQFEYEGYYDVLGQNNAKVESVLFNYFGFAIPIANRTQDHPTMIDPSGKDQELRTCMTPDAVGVTGETPPQIDCTEFGTLQEIDDDIRKLSEANSSGFVSGSVAEQRQIQLLEQRQNLIDCQNQQRPCENEDTADAAERTKNVGADQYKQECLDRNDGANLGADQNIELNFTDDEAVDAVCQAASEGQDALDGLEARQVDKIQLTQKVIGDLNNQIEDWQFELDRTPISDPTRIAQLEQAIADNEQRVVDLTDAIDVRSNIIGLIRGEQGYSEEADDQAPSGGCETAGGSASGNISNTGNEDALEGRAADEQRFQDLADQSNEANDAANRAQEDVEILKGVKTSDKAQELLNERAESYVYDENGELDVEASIAKRQADFEAAQANKNSIDAEDQPLADRLNASGGSTDVQPPPAETPETAVRDKFQQRLQGELLEAKRAVNRAKNAQTFFQQDIDKLEQMKADGATSTVGYGLNAATADLLKLVDYDYDRAIAEREGNIASAEQDEQEAQAEYELLDAKVKAP